MRPRGVDVVFAPSIDEMYPGGDPEVTVEPGPLGEVLEGEVRPGHFRGVLTVVAKLFGLTRPDVACFGEKDYQQLVLIRRMSRDLCLGVEVVGVPTVREPDGLALSSRNRYLDPTQRRRATILSRALDAAADRASYGLPAARWAAMRVLDEDGSSTSTTSRSSTPSSDVSVRSTPSTPVDARVLVAARIGKTRLIDNRAIVLGPVRLSGQACSRQLVAEPVAQGGDLEAPVGCLLGRPAAHVEPESRSNSARSSA